MGDLAVLAERGDVLSGDEHSSLWLSTTPRIEISDVDDRSLTLCEVALVMTLSSEEATMLTLFSMTLVCQSLRLKIRTPVLLRRIAVCLPSRQLTVATRTTQRSVEGIECGGLVAHLGLLVLVALC